MLNSAMAAENNTEPEQPGGRAWRNAYFLLLRTISYFTYEMVDNQSKTAREGGFRKHRTGCPLLPARPVL